MAAPQQASGGEPESFGTRLLSYWAIFAMLLLTTPGPTARLVHWLLQMVAPDAGTTREGTVLLVADFPPQVVHDLWTAAPVVALAGAVLLAVRCPLRKRLAGFLHLAWNCFLVNVLALGLLAQLPQDLELVDRLTQVYPALMLLTVASTLLFWFKRVLPERPVKSSEVGLG
ncbi:MAG: hypothetical protein IT204_00210 [Fimbriimonadaceae bacterium]|nr:hypothetical protein [Fimbriimonadaceae bacterium]